MKVTLLLADFARVASGKLDVIGGGWSMMNAQGPFGFFVAALFQIPWDRTNQKHQFRLELLDADGQGVPTPDGETIRAEGEFEAGRPAGLRPGTPVDASGSARPLHATRWRSPVIPDTLTCSLSTDEST